jgi:hypothetical protein
MSKKFVEYDPLTGVTNYFHALGNGQYVSEDVVDVAPTKDVNTRLFNDADKRWKHDANNHIASIPLPIYFDLKRKGIVADRKAFLKWLSDPDNRVFRTRPGNIV